MPPRWLSANLAYLRDIDYLEDRMARPAAKPKGGAAAKAKAEAKAAAKAGAAAAAARNT